MWLILSLSFLLALSSGTARVFADQRPAGLYTMPWLSLQLAQAAPPAAIDQRSLGEARPEAMRQCLQQALLWLGHYQGPVDGQASPAYIEALQTYASERDIELMRLETSLSLLRSLEHALATLGKVEEWQACREGAEPVLR
jgi:hypothetical protein